MLLKRRPGPTGLAGSCAASDSEPRRICRISESSSSCPHLFGGSEVDRRPPQLPQNFFTFVPLPNLLARSGVLKYPGYRLISRRNLEESLADRRVVEEGQQTSSTSLCASCQVCGVGDHAWEGSSSGGVATSYEKQAVNFPAVMLAVALTLLLGACTPNRV
jgi:hypothetical protein